MNIKKVIQQNLQTIYAIPLFLVMVIPLVVYGVLVESKLNQFPWFSDNGEILDLFLFYKKNTIIIVSCIIILFIFIMICQKGRKLGTRNLKHTLLLFLPFGLYVLLTILSSIFSPLQMYVWKGIMEQFESVWVIIGYFFICLYGYLAFCENFFIAFGIFSTIIGAIGTLQFFEVDIYRTSLFQKLCMPQNLQEITFHITAESGRSYCSLSNPNYVGMLCCLTIPILTVLTISARKRRFKILYGISNLLMLCSLIGSRSKSGILSTAICVIFMCILYRKQIHITFYGSHQKKPVLITVTLLTIGLIILLFWYHWDSFSENIRSLRNQKNDPDTQINEIATNNNSVKIVYHDYIFYFSLNHNANSLTDAINIVDESGKPYIVYENQGTLYFQLNSLSHLTASYTKYGNYAALEIGDGNYYWYFTEHIDNPNAAVTWYYITHYGKLDKLLSNEIAACQALNGKERIISGRGYIWSRTIPLLKKHILLGSGQDTFAAVFPNNDYLGMAKWGYKDMLITKPHCMYMQIAVQSGILSLIALGVFWIVYFIKTIKTAKSIAQISPIVIAVAVSILGYLLTALTNDSNVGTAPIFWLLLGIGLRLTEAPPHN